MRQALALVVLALVVVSGCTAPAGSSAESPDGPAGTSTATPTPTAATPLADTSTSTDGLTPTVTPNRSTVRGNGDAVEYANLTPTQQAAFDAALAGEVRFVPNSSYVDGEFHFDDAEPFQTHDFVVKNGTEYAIHRSSGDGYASYGIDASAEMNPADVNATVVAVANLSTDVRVEVRWAVENGSYGVPMGKWQSLPEELRETRYVRYDDEVYRLRYSVGDQWATVMTVERVE